MGREFELKYRATPEQIAGIRKIAGEYRQIAMETTYYDTPSRKLSPLHWTLRRRFENGISVCTMKTPATDGGRGEWELEWPDITTAVPELCKLGAPKELLDLTAEGLEEVCGARFTRQAALLTRPDCTVELALDQGVLLGGGREIPLCEVEVELKAGSEAAAIAFAETLANACGLNPEGRSKYRRALALANRKP